MLYSDKLPDGTLQAKLACIYRRSDISANLLASFETEYADYYEYLRKSSSSHTFSAANFVLLLKRAEVFYSNCFETDVSVECFRGKAHVRLLMMHIDTIDDFVDTDSSSPPLLSSSSTNQAEKSPRPSSLRPKRLQSRNNILKPPKYNILADKRVDKYFYLGIYNPNAKTLQCAHKACEYVKYIFKFILFKWFNSILFFCSAAIGDPWGINLGLNQGQKLPYILIFENKFEKSPRLWPKLNPRQII